MANLVLLVPAFFLTATLFSAVGNAGASGYLAAMAMVDIDPVAMKPTALAVNILVASVATVRYARAGQLSWRTFAPFAVGSVPFAAMGGRIELAGHIFNALVAVVLVVSAGLLVFRPALADTDGMHRPRLPVALALGALIGLLAGLTGTGGGVFLGPLLIFNRWDGPRGASGVSAAFILVNSVAALAANPVTLVEVSSSLPWLAGAALAGALLGTELGTRRMPETGLRLALAAVLVVAAVKLGVSSG